MSIAEKKEVETLTMEGNWDERSKLLQKQYSNLTDEDVRFETGKEEELIKKVEARLGKSRAEVISMIKEGQIERK